MLPTPTERDALFTGFARALFKGDLEALYHVVAPDFVWRYHDGLAVERVLASPEAIRDHIAERKVFFAESRFHDVVYHHLPDVSFMTFAVSEIVRSTAERREQRGIERYTFAGGRIATKDVYRKPIAG